MGHARLRASGIWESQVETRGVDMDILVLRGGGIQLRSAVAATLLAPGPIVTTPTFESAGLYWSPDGGGPEHRVHATFRRSDDARQRTSLDLVWNAAAGEYRGSLLMLDSGSHYEVTLWCGGQVVQTTSFSTWSEEFPIAKRVEVPVGVRGEPYRIRGVHGSPQGYVLFEPRDDTALDARHVINGIVVEDSSFVIIRGFQITGSQRSAIYLKKTDAGTVHDIVIEDNEITNWGRIALYTETLRGTVAAGDTIRGSRSGATGVVVQAPKVEASGHVIFYADDNGLRFRDGERVVASSGGGFETHTTKERNGYVHGFGGYGSDDYAIQTDDMKDSGRRFVIQRNHIHSPRGDTNAWNEFSILNGGSIGDDPPRTIRSHPKGPGGIILVGTQGNHVIRYNTIHGAPGPTPGQADKNGRYLFDGIGGRPEGTTGGVHRDSDVYGNDIRHVWDDAIEAEAYDVNVRIWANRIDESYVLFGLAPVAEGPLYLFRNIGYRSRRSYLDGYRSGDFIKNNKDGPSGAVFVLHNTLWSGPERNGGVNRGLKNRHDGYYLRNNIIRAVNAYGSTDSRGGDYDYDLFQGQVAQAATLGPNSIELEAIYAAPDSTFLAAATPGRRDALVLPNLEWVDRGAEQAGQPPLAFGHDAARD
jgi:hypothetical protein